MKEYAHILRAIAEGLNVQWQSSDGRWQNQRAAETLSEISNKEYRPARYRVHVRTININGHEVPEPLRVAPNANGLVFMPHLSDRINCCSLAWHGDAHQKTLLARGLLHSSEEAAIAHARALLSFTEQKP